MPFIPFSVIVFGFMDIADDYFVYHRYITYANIGAVFCWLQHRWRW